MKHIVAFAPYYPLVVLILLILVRKTKTSHDNVVFIFLITSFLTELAGAQVWKLFNIGNYFLYNFYNLFVYLLFIQHYKNLKHVNGGEKWYTAAQTVLIILFVGLWVWRGDINSGYVIPVFLVGALFLLCVIFHYLYNVMQSDTLYNFVKQRILWISAALMVFYIPFLPIMTLHNYLIQNFINLFLAIFVLNLLMYAIFVYGFIIADED
jgi:hypothetical protein